jgi:hypothetical protein
VDIFAMLRNAGSSIVHLLALGRLVLQRPIIVSGMVYTVIPLAKLHLPSCSDVRNHDNCTGVTRAIQVPKYVCTSVAAANAEAAAALYLDGRNDTHAYSYDNSSIVAAWNESICTIQEPFCRHSRSHYEFPNGTTLCHNGTLNQNLVGLRPTATNLGMLSDWLYDSEVYGEMCADWYEGHFCHSPWVQNDTELNLTEIAAVLKQPALPGDIALQYVCRKPHAGDGTNNDDGLAVRYFDWKDGSLYGTSTDDGEELQPGWTCTAEEVWYNPFNFTWENSGALNDGTLSDCNGIKESDTGGTSLPLNSGAGATMVTTTTLATAAYTMLACALV